MLRTRCAIGLGAVVAVVTGCGGDATSPGPPAAADVRIGQCARDPASGYPEVSGTVTNHTARWNDYTVVVVMRQGGRPVWAPDLTVVAVPPDRSQPFSEGDVRTLAAAPVTCSVATVGRTVRTA